MTDHQKKKTIQVKDLTPSQLDDFRSAFDMFDKDGSGAISKEELGEVMSQLGFAPTDEELRDMINEHDSDKSGQIEFNEFCGLMTLHMNNDECADETLKAAFDTFDKDKSGKISSDELRQVMTLLGENLSDMEISEMIREADLDGDGQINYEEFVSMMVKD
jgi:calmodulin